MHSLKILIIKNSDIHYNHNMARSERNKTLTLEEIEKEGLLKKTLINIHMNRDISDIENKVVLANIFDIAKYLPCAFVDILILDPPYNLSKNFGVIDFKKSNIDEYTKYVDDFLSAIIHTLTDTASIYICGDWYSSTSLYLVANKYFYIHNRITWQREKGRGSKHNWKNAHEDIWFCTKSKNYTFNVEKVKTRKKVIAPYKENGKPKDWQETEEGNFRDTHPSNFWGDITIPYWSMAENTEHPTQKPEKLIAKLILASSNEGDFVFDPFVGSGTSCVVAKKLNRKYLGVDMDEKYVCLAQKRLDTIQDNTIQGYSEGVFWERNTLVSQKKKNREGLLW